MNSIYPAFISLFFSGSYLSAQTQDITLGTVNVCADQDVLLPITATGLYNIGAITLYIGFDSTRLVYSAIENRDPQLEDITIRKISAPAQLVITWSNVTGANFPQTKLFDIAYHYISGNNAVEFNPECEIADVNLQILTVSYTNGLVDDGTPIIGGQPQNLAINAGLSAVFQVTSPNTSRFHWKESKNNGITWTYLSDEGKYQGTHEPTLMISDVPDSFTGNMYRCIMGEGSCSDSTATAKLTVYSMSAGHETECNSNPLKIHPNPFDGITRIDYSLSGEGNVQLTLINGNGQTIYELLNAFQERGAHEVLFDAGGFPSGIYLCHMDFQDKAGKGYTAIHKLVKNN
ncbi:MAG: hypothetical protein WCI71_01980 [Bacteroidota bacterium]